MQRGLSKENQASWTKAIRLTRNSNVEANVCLYLKKVIKNGHFVDVPCFIDADAVEKSNKYTFKKALAERNLGILQILAPMKNNPNELNVFQTQIGIEFQRSPIFDAARYGHLNVIKVFAPITENPNSHSHYGGTQFHQAAINGNAEILKFLFPFTAGDPFRFYFPTSSGEPLIYVVAGYGHIDILKFLAPLTKNPNSKVGWGEGAETPIERAQSGGHHEFARILETYIKA